MLGLVVQTIENFETTRIFANVNYIFVGMFDMKSNARLPDEFLVAIVANVFLRHGFVGLLMLHQATSVGKAF